MRQVRLGFRKKAVAPRLDLPGAGGHVGAHGSVAKGELELVAAVGGLHVH